jgi:Kef-type K+ transport system membrane component KefB
MGSSLAVLICGRPVLLAAGAETALQPLLVQLTAIILAARLGATIARRCGQPSVVGEIVAGLLLGPSALGAVAPELSAWLFGAGRAGQPAGLEAALTSLSQIGLVLLMFLVGLEFDFTHVRRQGRLAFMISLAGVALPFALGVGLAAAMAPRLGALGAETAVDPRSFALFLGTALSITAIPILGRILIEMGMQHTLLGATVIAAAACDDAIGWTLLAAVSAIAVGRFDPWDTARMIAATAAFAATAFLVIRPLALPWLEHAVADAGDEAGAEGPPHAADHGRLPTGALSLVLAAIFAAALVTSRIGIFAIFGAFLLGAALSGRPRLREAVSAQLTAFVTVFFLPIFFTYTGLRTNIGALGSFEAWGWCVAVLSAAVLGKWGGCGLAARLCGMPQREASCVGVLMNTRALMELVVCNVGMDLGVIPPAVYCMLVLMAIITTLMATPLAVRLLRGTPHEPGLVARGFLPARRAG